MTKIQTVPFKDVYVDEDIPNIRGIDTAWVKELARSIESRGLEEPIKVIKKKNGKFAIVHGFHRHAAWKLIYDKMANKKNWRDIPVTFFAKDDPLAARSANFVANVVRKNLNPAEMVCAAEQLIAEGADKKVLAADIGYSAGRFGKLISDWSKAGEGLRMAALLGQVPMDVLSKFVKKTTDPKEQAVMAKKYVDALQSSGSQTKGGKGTHKSKREAKRAAGITPRPTKKVVRKAMEELAGVKSRKFLDGFYTALLCFQGEEDLMKIVRLIKKGEDVELELEQTET
jgi:ParB-like chromosome segregation protein Spo0J